MPIRKLISALIVIFALSPILAIAVTTYTVGINGANYTNAPTSPNIWYVSASNTGSGSGTSQANSVGINNINWYAVQPGDTFYVCGLIRSSFNFQKGGFPGYPTVLRGDCPTNPGIISGANLLTGSWTSVGSNVYTVPLSGFLGYQSAGIIAEDDTALIKTSWTGSSSTTISALASCQSGYTTGCWAYDSTDNILYVIATGLDSPSGHTMEDSYGGQYSTQISGFAVNYVTVENLTVKDAGGYGIDFSSGAFAPSGYWAQNGSNITINNCHIYNNFNWAIYIGGQTNVTVTNNIIDHAVWAGHLPIESAVGEVIRYDTVIGGTINNNTVSYSPSAGIDLHGTSNGITVYNNTVHDNVGMTNQYAGGIYSDNAQNNFIYRNYIYNWKVGIALSTEGGPPTSGTYVYNNVIFNSVQDGFILGANYTNSILSQNNFIYNNTIVFGNETLSVGGSSNDTFQNNIVYGNGEYQGAGYSGTFCSGCFDYNNYIADLASIAAGSLYYTAWQAGVNGDLHSVFTSKYITNIGTLTFVHPSGVPPTLNLQLVAGSVAVGAGKNLYSTFTTDFACTIRPSSAAWDNGAYQNI